MKIEVEVRLTPAQLAQAFWALDDERQAQFFIDAARIAHEICAKTGGNPGFQWFSIGGHLRNCPCSTYEARQMVEDIASAAGGADGK